MAHYFETDNLAGDPVEHRFVKRIVDDLWVIRHDVIVNGVGTDTSFVPLDSDAGMTLLADYAVPLDCLKEEN